MYRDEYLNNKDVKGFIKWLKLLLDIEGLFFHCYTDRRSGRSWKCTSVYEAYINYHWSFNYRDQNNRSHSGATFLENAVALNDLRNQLRSAFSSNNAEALCAVSCKVLKWGGVSNRNADWCRSNIRELVSIYREGMRLLKPANANDIGLFPSKFNSGMSKIYSLLLNEYIIYDSRVGAALGHLVVRHCQTKELKFVPFLLRFPWAPAKEVNPTNPKNRDPSVGYLSIEPIKSSQDHARWNLRASWLFIEAANQSNKFAKLNDPLRALEAALFMIGYDLGGGFDYKSRNKTDESMVKVEDHGYPLKTVGRGFFYRVDFDSERGKLVFSYPVKSNGKRRSPDLFSLEDIINICHYLVTNFHSSAFPLGNNVERLSNLTEKAGLGMAIRSLPGADVLKAQASSYLGPYLAEVGIFELINKHPAMWNIVVNTEDVISVIMSYHNK